MPERKILTEALKRAFGAASVESVHHNLEKENLIIGMREGRRMATTREVLAEERRMIGFAREGRGTCRPLGDALYAIKRDWLNDGQRRAVRYLLTSKDRVMLIRGAAGTGKTSMAQEAVEAIEAGGKRVFMFAPSADASRGVLREDGFAHADTVARLLFDERMQSEVRGQVIWIDEAGLLGSRQMTEVFDLADRLTSRVILSGDRKQHGSVEHGAALRLLETEAGLIPAEIRDIKRQQGEYRQAVEALSEGRTEDGFRELDELGWIKEVPTLDRYKTLARDYVAAIADGKSTALVVSPTHLEGEWVTDEIRAQLNESGELKGQERRVMVLENTNLTEAQRADSVNYDEDCVLVFHQNAKGFQKGERVAAGARAIPISEAAKFQVFKRDVLPIAPGDVIRITRNGKTLDGKHRLNNGAIFPVKKFDANGDIVLANGWTVAQDYGHLSHGYCITSHAAQGKTVDHVFIGQSSQSFPASSREQFYVSASRGAKASPSIPTTRNRCSMPSAARTTGCRRRNWSQGANSASAARRYTGWSI
ncbi:MAG: AAA family ATPase [Planctomycetia bacterium]|nr:AAA family ATPase [Planctomycetia bacterium]